MSDGMDIGTSAFIFFDDNKINNKYAYNSSSIASYSDTPPPPPPPLSLIPLLKQRKVMDSSNSSSSLMYSDNNNSYSTSKETMFESSDRSPQCVSHFDRHNNFYAADNSRRRRQTTKIQNTTIITRPRPLPALRRNLLKHHEQQDPTEYYNFRSVLGTGSMGSVLRVKKRLEVVGGSARPSFVKKYQRRKENKESKTAFEDMLQSCFLFCPFARHTENHSHLDLLQAAATSDYDDDDECLVNFEGHPEIEEESDYRYSHKSREIVYALKTTRLDRSSASEFMQELQNEVDILKDLDHPNIVRAFETFRHKEQHYIVMECCSGGNLYARDPYTEQDAAKIIRYVLGAIAYLHSKNIIHRDIKFENILFISRDMNNLDVKLIDFGLSRRFTPGTYLHTRVGTAYSMAPELLKAKYTSSADVWSIGVLAYMLLSSSMPFYGKKRNQMFRKIVKGKYNFHGRRWNTVSNDAKQFVSCLLELDPERRPTAKQALINSSWLAQCCSGDNEHRFYEYQQQYVPAATSSDSMNKVIASMERYANYGMLKKIALMVAAFQSTSDEIGLLQNIFEDKFVGDNNVITLPEFKQALMGEYLYSDDEVEQMFYGIDILGNGVIDYSEFLASTIEANGSIQEDRLAEAFNRLDCDNSGYISMSNLEEILQEEKHGNRNAGRFIRDIINEVDADKDGVVSYNDFLAMWDTSHNYDSHPVVQVDKRRTQWRLVDETAKLDYI